MADWRIKARYYEACNCAYGCPCNFNGFPTHGNCEGLVAFEVTEGERDGLDLSGARVAAAVSWPAAIHDGGGTMALFIDAPEEQREPLLSILSAADGGLPWEILASTISEIKGPFFERIEISDSRTESTVRVGDRFTMEMESFKNPVTGDPHEVHTVLPTGFIFTDGWVCTTRSARVDADGVRFDHSGNNAYWSEVEWSNVAQAAAATPTRFG